MSERTKRVGANVESGSVKRNKKEKEDKFISGLPTIKQLFEKQSSAGEGEATNSLDPINSVDIEDEELDSAPTLSSCDTPSSGLHESHEAEVFSDPALWTRPFSLTFVDRCLEKGPNQCRNNDGIYEKSLRVTHTKSGKEPVKRKLTKACFEFLLPNGSSAFREWLIYSPSAGNVYCFYCRLFSKEDSPFIKAGFSDWKNASAAFTRHERSEDHTGCMLTFADRKSNTSGIDKTLVELREKERDYWIKVLERIVETIRMLATRGLAFRGDDEVIGSKHNGNYLGMLELIANFDPFLEEHLRKYGNAGRGVPSYLSSTICEEMIHIMWKLVFDIEMEEIRSSIYYSISIDSTPDLTHQDQLTFTFRYVLPTNPVER